MDKFKEIINNKSFVGIVEDNEDPDKKMRLKVRIPFLHGSKDQIPTESLPWSQPKKNSPIKFEIPDINKIVNITFPTGEMLFPVYDGVEHLDVNLQEKIEKLSNKDYTDFISFCYNYNTQIYISNKDGLNLFHKKSGVQIKDNGDVVTRLNGNSSSYYIGDENATQSMILGNNWFIWMDQFMQVLQGEFLLDSNGNPCVPTPELLEVITKYNAMRKLFLSENVFVNDNFTITPNTVKTKRQKGDKYETINETEEIELKIQELQAEEVKEEIKKEQEKKQTNDEKTDEKVNEEDGLLANGSNSKLKKHVKENKDIVTEDIEVDEEKSEEGSESDESSYYSEFYNESGNFTDSDSGSSNVSDNTDNSPVNTDGPTADDYWEPEYYIPPEKPSNLSIGGNPTNGRRAGKDTARKIIKTEKEELDLSVLPAPGMMSKFLSYDKCLYSNTANRLGIENRPDNNDHLNNLIKVTKYYWDIPFKFFKEKLGYILVLNSAYRNLEVNEEVGGSKTSQHKSGSAVDIILTKDGNAYPKSSRLNNLLFYYLKHRMNHFGQLIWEGNASDGPQWCHISLNNAGKTGQIFPAVGGVIKEPNRETVKILQEYGIWKPELEDKQYSV